MARWKYFYVFRIEFLGYAYYGWQTQTGLPTVQETIEKKLTAVFGHENFKILGCGRTDAKVSALDFAFELFTTEAVNTEELIPLLNKKLPADIRIKYAEPTNAKFNIIQTAKEKEYHYHFCGVEQLSTLATPMLHNFGSSLNIEAMQQAAKLFEGKHNFRRFTRKITPHTILEREITHSSIAQNESLAIPYLYAPSYTYIVKSPGFLTYQIRLMIGTLADVGKGLMTIPQLEEALANPQGEMMHHIAPASGLKLVKINFEG